MESVLQQRVTLIWILLILATGLSWEFGHGFGFGERYHYATIAIFLITLIKIRFVFLDFMELRTAPTVLRVAFEAWSVLVCGTIIFLYWSGL